MSNLTENQQRKRTPRWLTFCLNTLLVVLLAAMLLGAVLILGYSIMLVYKSS